ncbi:ParB/RepB/Spo0J family partition protein [Johnsonella ignava]|uniref:ParB/RepB/Spo0J family partition protein n=1 Tax=Johnsonella ignava TaxID=43995 RepID=UPI0023F3A37E|nr:ParB/RepB/Spo0J family partition protein [Johnsonella ignava]
MPKKGANISLSSYDDIFSTQESRQETGEHVVMLPLDKIHPFKNHPFRIVDDEEMQKTAESIREYGVLVPAIVRPLENDEYEMISGHRRRYASMLAGKETMPIIIRDMDDDTATIFMVDSNLQREHILPSERAKAYQMKVEAIKHQGQKRAVETTSRQVVGKLEAAALIGDEIGQSGRQVQRFMRLNNLIPEILDMVDEKKIAFNPAVELSYLKPEEQREFLEAMDYAQTTPSVSQAQRIKKLSQQGQSSLEAMCEVMDEVKKPPDDRLVIKSDVLRKYFPKSYTPQQMEAVIMKLLEQWLKKRTREPER